MRRALIIGVNEYDSHAIVNLQGAVRDAEVVGEFFRAGLPTESRFETTLLLNPTSSEVLAALLAIQKELDDDSTFVFYFAGHALVLKDHSGASLLCRDASEYVLSGATDCGTISPAVLQQFSRNGRGKMFFCFGASRRGASARGVSGDSDSFRLRDWWRKPTAHRFSLYSCHDGECCRDDGVFADTLVAEMKSLVAAGREITLDDKFVEAVAKRMRESEPRQTPDGSGTPFTLVPGSERDD